MNDTDEMLPLQETVELLATELEEAATEGCDEKELAESGGTDRWCG